MLWKCCNKVVDVTFFKLEYSNISKKEKQGRELNATLQSNKVRKKKDLRSRTVCSYPLKFLAFLSRQKLHIMQCGTAFQKAIFLYLPKAPCQAANILMITLFGITHWSSNKQHTIVHNSKAIVMETAISQYYLSVRGNFEIFCFIGMGCANSPMSLFLVLFEFTYLVWA